MIRLLFVGDGPRDAASVPRLVQTILATPFDGITREWARLHGEAGRGLPRKLRFAILLGRDKSAAGLVGTIDADKDPRRQRLRTLQDARQEERVRGTTMGIALGEASPHGEAWLLDDAVAVREALQLAADANIPTTRQTRSPKAALEQLLTQSALAGRRPVEIWPKIAERVELQRCAHAEETGFAAFAKDVRAELGPLFPKRE